MRFHDRSVCVLNIYQVLSYSEYEDNSAFFQNLLQGDIVYLFGIYTYFKLSLF